MPAGNRVAANLNMLFTNLPLLQRYGAAAAAGFKLVEVSIPYSEPANKLRQAADEHRLEHTLINAPPGNWDQGFRGLASLKSEKEAFRNSLDTAIEYARALDCKRVHIMAGIPRTADDVAHASATYSENVRFAAQKLKEHNLLCLIEPINKYTIPGYHLHNYEQAMEVINQDDSQNLKIQYDTFHAQQINGQVGATLRRLKEHIGYIQVAQVPARGACDTRGELDYHFIFSEIGAVNAEWVIGAEYLDGVGAKESFGWVIEMAVHF
uniref:Putative hydroxypyruvate isomerase n=1 Tax=Caenorhabditis japonica TaxID=281687 RepID=A0A8R1HUA1_CAEJA